MTTKPRIQSILEANNLDYSITGLQTFDLSKLHLVSDLEFDLPSNLRLGHLAEKVVSELIRSSTNYDVLYENIQVIEGKRTIGEIDFIVQNIAKEQLIHMELAYKFYLYDPSISSEPINNWIGPNRNDSLIEKLEKLKRKQFPLLYHDSAQAEFNEIEINQVSQALCLLVSLFIPYEYEASFGSDYEKAIKGFYLDFEGFCNLDNSAKTYYLPPKKEWGIDPSENEMWADFSDVEDQIKKSIQEKQAPLCWQKYKNSYSAFFIVWW